MRFLLVDDHPLLRLGVRHLVEAEWHAAAIDECETLAEAIQALAAARPDVIVLDLNLPDAVGLDGPTKVVRAAAGVPVLVLSQQAEREYAARLLRLGVRGYLPKHRAAADLVPAVRRLLTGGRYVTPELGDHLVEMMDRPADELGRPHEALSAQEFRVMLQIAAGRTPAQIGESMHLSPKTVGSYRARIFEKTGWRSTAELTRYCVQHGLSEDVPPA